MIGRVVKIAALLIAFVAVTAASAYLALTLIIKSEETVIVPELVGKEVVYALELLTGLELDIKVKGSEYSSRVPKHHVVFQQPAAGSEIKKGRDVKIILSKGPETIFLRDLAGLTIRQAEAVLEDEGLCTGVISSSFHPSVARGHIIAQYPFAKAPIARSRCVDLLVSNGRRPEFFVMPAMEGMPLDKAVLLLEPAKLSVNRIARDWDRRHPREAVLSQEPSAGSHVGRQTPIRLVVNRPPGGDTLVGAGFSARMHLFRHQTGSGYLRRKLRVEIGDGQGLNVLINEFVEPGEEIWLFIPPGAEDRISVFENDVPIDGMRFTAQPINQ